MEIVVSHAIVLDITYLMLGSVLVLLVSQKN